MAIHRALAVVSEVVAELEQEWGLRSVETVVEGDASEVRARVEVPISPCAGIEGEDAVDPVDATLTADGELQVSYGPGDAVIPTVDRPPVEVTTREVSVRESVGIVACLDLRITPPDWAPPESGATAAVDRQSDGRAEADSDAGTDASGAGTDTSGDGTPIGDAGSASESSETAGTASPRVPSEDGREPADVGEAADGGDRPEAESSDEGRSRDPSAGDTSGPSSDGPAEVAAVRDPSVPPYEDEAYLRALYEHCDTFARMREAIEMDVSAETVRRYMIEAGIHEPDRYDTGADEATDDGARAAEEGLRASHSDVRGRTDAGPPPEIADVREALELEAAELDLPDEFEMTDLVDAVVYGRSTHEVARELNLDHDVTRDLLRQLNLVDLVSYRLTEAADHETSYETVTARLRQGGAEVA